MSWSLSRLGTFEKCAAQYKYRYLEDRPATQSVSAGRGQELHTAMEMFIKGELNVLPSELDFYTQFLTGLKDNPEYELFPEHKLAVDKNWQPCDFDGDYWWRGMLDLLLVSPLKLMIYDWKSGGIYDDHQDQRELYSIGTFAHYPDVKEITAVHVYVDKRELRQTIYHRWFADELRKKWDERASKMLNSQEFIPSPGFYCRYCSYSRAKGGPCQF